MKKIKLKGKYGLKKVTLVDDNDFSLVQNISWRAGLYMGKLYAVSGSSKFMHRLLMDAPKGMSVDHINGDSLDNRRENLRVCTHAENSRNRKISKNNKSGYNGVYLSRGKWRAQVKLNGKTKSIGSYLKKEHAAEAYNRFASLIYGKYARLNLV